MRRPLKKETWTRPLLSSLGLLVAYYAFPFGLGVGPAAALGLLLTAAGLGLLVWMMVAEVGHLRRGEATRSSQALSMLLMLLVMGFSLAFFLLNHVRPDEVAGLDTRTDALYFTLSTMATVGYGDVHAEGQVARGLVSGLIVFNVVVVTALVRAQTARRADDRAT
jgi:hypothetical protein